MIGIKLTTEPAVIEPHFISNSLPPSAIFAKATLRTSFSAVETNT